MQFATRIENVAPPPLLRPLRMLHRLWPPRLTVLAYHRIADPRNPRFLGLAANVSATAEAFDAQIRLIRQYFTIVSLDALLAWMGAGVPLPANPLMITFDDGYRDMLDAALPVLRRHEAPAVLFLATGCVGNPQPFFWDLAAYCFRHTEREAAELPLTGAARWPNAAARHRALHEWLAAAKSLPIAAIAPLMERLQSALAVAVPAATFAGQHLEWADVRTLARAGVAIGAHTHGHAILSRLTPPAARAEIAFSKQRIEAELGEPVRAFAYPNGRAEDYRPEHVRMLREEKVEAAFTLVDGPATLSEVRRRPLEIRRILVMANDDLAAFAAKLAGVARLVRPLRAALLRRS